MKPSVGDRVLVVPAASTRWTPKGPRTVRDAPDGKEGAGELVAVSGSGHLLTVARDGDSARRELVDVPPSRVRVMRGKAPRKVTSS